MPYMRRSGVSVKASLLVRPPLIVSTTPAPMSTEPRNSQMPATTIACFIVSALAPTEEPNALATSFAPMPQATKRERKMEQTKTAGGGGRQRRG